MYKIRKKFKFEASHRLNQLPKEHKCSNFHGHSYVIYITIWCSKLNDDGMIVDFGKLKIFQDWLDRLFDHKLILSEKDPELVQLIKTCGNSITTMKEFTTAESMCKTFYHKLCHTLEELQVPYENVEVEVQETEGNSAFYYEG